jgi:hypothetical protein
MTIAPQKGDITVGVEERNVSVSFVGKLDIGENLASVVGVVDLDSTGKLTFSNQAVSVKELTINGAAVPAGRAAQFKVSAIAAGVYRIRVTVTTDAAPPQTTTLDLYLTATQ